MKPNETQSKKLKDLYSTMIEKIKVNSNEYKAGKKLCVFNVNVGEDYGKHIKLMVVGRATNGWDFSFNNSEDFDKKKLDSRIDKFDNTDWIIESWNKNVDSTIQYHFSKSAFLRVAKDLALKINNSLTGLDVFKSIAYSNLYKVSYEEGGNPSSKLIDIQHNKCAEILWKEIEILQPEIIVFLTGYEWAKWFLKGADCKILIGGHVDKEKNKFVEIAGKFKNAKFVIGQHPQGKDESDHVDEILKAIKI